VVGCSSGHDGEVGQRDGVHGGVYLMRLEDGPVDEDQKAGGEDECASATATRLVSVAAGAEHGERRRRRERMLVNGGRSEGGRGSGVHMRAALSIIVGTQPSIDRRGTRRRGSPP
jgi:hypothetical protein